VHADFLAHFLGGDSVLNSIFGPLRNDPRFEKIVASLASK